MKPDLGKFRLGVGAAALGDFVFVVRELQIIAAAMNIKRRPQQFIRHGRAFDMPPRTAAAPWAIPAGGVGIRWFPQHEIHRVLFEGGDLDPSARDHIIDRPPRQRAIVFIRPYPKQRVAILGIGVTFGDQILDHCDHLADILRRAGFVIGAQGAKGIHIRVIPADGFLGPFGDQFLDRAGITGVLAGLGGGVDLVIHIGEVPDVSHRIGTINMAQQAVQNVKHHHRPRVPKVRAIIDRRPADIHPHIGRVDRRKGLFAAGLGVVQLDRRHSLSHAVFARGLSNYPDQMKRKRAARETDVSR